MMIIIIIIIIIIVVVVVVDVSDDDDDDDDDDDNNVVSCSLSFVFFFPEISKLCTYVQHRAGLKYVGNRQARVAGARGKLSTEGATIYYNCVLYM